MLRRSLVVLGFVAGMLVSPVGGFAGELLVGTAVVDITPAGPVAVSGQFHLRIAETVESPVTANVIALESRLDGISRDIAIMVSCDLLYIPSEVLELVRKAVRKRLADMDTNKIFLNGTHRTRTRPPCCCSTNIPFRPKEWCRSNSTDLPSPTGSRGRLSRRGTIEARGWLHGA
ncbi:MAG: hypothetical protein ACYSW8_08040 [Planctomycetota bacterium]